MLEIAPGVHQALLIGDDHRFDIVTLAAEGVDDVGLGHAPSLGGDGV